MSSLEARAEVLKLATLLGVSPARLAYLEPLDPIVLRGIREEATDLLFQADLDRLERIAAASRIVPPQIAARIARIAFPPRLSARITGQLDPGRAVEMARRMPAAYLADVAVAIDPRRVSAIIARIDPELVQAVGRLLGDRQEYVTMGRFVGHVADVAIRPTLGVLSDEALLHTAFVLEDKTRLDPIVALLPDERLGSLMRAAHSAGLWPEALDLVPHLRHDTLGQLAEAAAEQDDVVLESMLAVAHEQRLWDLVLPVARAMHVEARQRFAGLAALQLPERIDAIVRAAAAGELWDALLPLVPLLGSEARSQVGVTAGEVVAAMSEPELERFLASLREHDLWGEVLLIAEGVPGPAVSRLARQATAVDVDSLVERVVEAADRTGLWPQGLGLLARLDAGAKQALAERAGELSPRLRARVLEEARAAGVLDQLGWLGAALAS